MRSRWSLSIAAVLTVFASATPAAAPQLAIPFASGAITAAATADPDEPQRPARPDRPALVRVWTWVRSTPAAFLTMLRLRVCDRGSTGVAKIHRRNRERENERDNTLPVRRRREATNANRFLSSFSVSPFLLFGPLSPSAVRQQAVITAGRAG
jgi:hypothetical protein